ncbi:MAG: membrane protein DedA with SNARE-associated domain [Arcobacteraceae bacterium]|jgi:membrane protein DedA with SNARE-associated domain
MIHEIAQFITDSIFDMGYLGIFLLMLIESSFIPFPSEIVLVPAGYLASKGDMNISLILLASLLGSVSGALINYFGALYVGRKFLLKYGKYILVSEETLNKMETFFKTHGAISTFTGRLIPGIRQLISIPAGLSKMNLKVFIFYTSLGALIWSIILVALGYIIGENQELIKQYLSQIVTITLVMVLIITVIYIYNHKRKNA